MSTKDISFWYTATAHTRNNDAVCVALSMEVKAPYVLNEAAVRKIYDPLLQQLVDDWAAHYDSAVELLLDAESFQGELAVLEHHAIPAEYHSVYEIAPEPPTHSRERASARPGDSPISQLDQRTQLLESLSQWLADAPQKYPVAFSNPEDKKHIKTMIENLKRQIRAGVVRVP